jgi:hypothetical protein
MNATNLVTASNVNYLKFNILNMVNSFVSIDAMFENIEIAMGQFIYENELVETIVFSFVKEECYNKLDLINKNYGA